MSKVLQATKFFIFVWLTLIVSGVYAQDYQIKGKVTDVESGLGLPGVNVVVKDAEGNIGTVTDIDGAYSLSVPSGADVLIFSYVGFITQEIQISGRSVIDIIMEEDIEQLGEVVVTALGITREKESLGYAVSDVSGDELAEVKSLNAVNALSGKVAGVDIQQGNTGIGGSSKVTIRGNSKITGSNQPLYVIDGVPMDNASMGQAGEWGGQDLGDGISSINPDDIETISVLKGPAAAALYGTRASNGVILITTKSWNEKDGTKFNVDFTSNMTIDNIVGHYDDIQYIYGQGINTPPRDISDALYLQSWGDKLDPNLEFITFDGQYRDYGIKPNHIGSFFRTGAALQNTVSLSGGNKDASFRFSIGDTKMNDIVQNSGLHRNSFSLRGTMKMWDRLMVDTKATYVREDIDNRPYLGYSGANVALALMALPANFDQHWLEESKTDENGNYIPWHSQSRITNPYYSLYDMVNNSKKNRVMGYTSLNYEFTDWLTLRVKSGIDTYSYLFYDYSPISTPTRESGEMRELNSRTTEINSEFLLTASKQLNEDWYASGSVGGNIMKFESKTIDILAQGQVSAGLITINNYGDFNIQNKIPRKQINSLYAFANVGYKDYLFADVTARNDWSSTLPVDNNSYFYPSITTAFVFTQAFDIRSNILSY
ncbi:MAG: SusC/RagA family TonB-linked outer membrane protein, partial [Bacteroidota bacterium]